MSVIIPAFNAEATLGRAIESVQRQDIETQIIVVDDDSQDDTPSVAVSYRVNKIFAGVNEGPGPARNHGIKEANGDFLLFLDADDELGRHQLKEADVAWCPTVMLHDGHARVIAPAGHQAFFLGGETLPIHSQLIRREVCPKFDPSYFFEDREWASRIFLKNLKFAFTPKTACVYNWGDPKPRQLHFAKDCRRIRKRLRNWLLSPDGGQKDEKRIYLACLRKPVRGGSRCIRQISRMERRGKEKPCRCRPLSGPHKQFFWPPDGEAATNTGFLRRFTCGNRWAWMWPK